MSHARNNAYASTSRLQGEAIRPMDPETKGRFAKQANRQVENGKQVQQQQQRARPTADPSRLFHQTMNNTINQDKKRSTGSQLAGMPKIVKLKDGEQKQTNPQHDIEPNFVAPDMRRGGSSGSHDRSQQYDNSNSHPTASTSTSSSARPVAEFYASDHRRKQQSHIDLDQPPVASGEKGVEIKGAAATKGKGKAVAKKATTNAKKKQSKEVEVITLDGESDEEDDIEDSDGDANLSKEDKVAREELKWLRKPERWEDVEADKRESVRVKGKEKAVHSSPDPLTIGAQVPWQNGQNVAAKIQMFERASTGSGSKPQPKVVSAMQGKSQHKSKKVPGAGESDDEMIISSGPSNGKGKGKGKADPTRGNKVVVVPVQMWSLNDTCFPILHEDRNYGLCVNTTSKGRISLVTDPGYQAVASFVKDDILDISVTSFARKQATQMSPPFVTLLVKGFSDGATKLYREIGMDNERNASLKFMIRLDASEELRSDRDTLELLLKTDHPFAKTIAEVSGAGAFDVRNMFEAHLKKARGDEGSRRAGPASAPVTRKSKNKPEAGQQTLDTSFKNTSRPSRLAEVKPASEPDLDAEPQRRSTRRHVPTHHFGDAPDMQPRSYAGDDSKIVLVYPPDQVGSIAVTQGDTKRLEDGEFLNDTLLEYGLKKILLALKDEEASDVHMFNSFFYKKLSGKKPTDVPEIYKSIRKWTSKIKLFEKKFLVIPINEHLHWYLAVIVNPGALLKPSVLPAPAKSQPAPIRRSNRNSSGGADGASAADADDERDNGDTKEDEAKDEAKEEELSAGILLAAQNTQQGVPAEELEGDGDGDVQMADGQGTTAGNSPSTGNEIAETPERMEGQEAAASSEDENEEAAVEANLLVSQTSISRAEVLQPTPISPSLVAPDEKRTEAPPTPIFPSLVAPDEKETDTPPDPSLAPTDASSQDVVIVDDQPVKLDDLCYILTFDSLGSTHGPVLSRLKKYLVCEAEDKLQVKPEEENNVVAYSVPVPNQENYCDCGLYVMHYVERFLNDPNLRSNVLTYPAPTKKKGVVADELWDSGSAIGRRGRFRDEVKAASIEWIRDWAPKIEEEKLKAEEEKRLRREAKKTQQGNVEYFEGIKSPPREEEEDVEMGPVAGSSKSGAAEQKEVVEAGVVLEPEVEVEVEVEKEKEKEKGKGKKKGKEKKEAAEISLTNDSDDIIVSEPALPPPPLVEDDRFANMEIDVSPTSVTMSNGKSNHGSPEHSFGGFGFAEVQRREDVEMPSVQPRIAATRSRQASPSTIKGNSTRPASPAPKRSVKRTITQSPSPSPKTQASRDSSVEFESSTPSARPNKKARASTSTHTQRSPSHPLATAPQRHMRWSKEPEDVNGKENEQFADDAISPFFRQFGDAPVPDAVGDIFQHPVDDNVGKAKSSEGRSKSVEVKGKGKGKAKGGKEKAASPYADEHLVEKAEKRTQQAESTENSGKGSAGHTKSGPVDEPIVLD